MALFLLNISVDTADSHPEHIPEDLSINDQESIIEIVFEKVLGYENSFKEYDDHDREDHNKKSNLKIDLTIYYLSNIENDNLLMDLSKQFFSQQNNFVTKGFYNLDTPPPKF
tara:strand:- start:5289 stop:5624 length:336 start_codon:yes stop_codon:yes gene_type:complete